MVKSFAAVLSMSSAGDVLGLCYRHSSEIANSFAIGLDCTLAAVQDNRIDIGRCRNDDGLNKTFRWMQVTKWFRLSSLRVVLH